MKKLVFIFALLTGFILSGCAAGKTPSSSLSGSSAVSQQASNPEAKSIYSDKLVEISFVKKYDAPGMPGEFFFELQATNKSSKKITVYLKDVYVNDKTVQIGSGVPLDVPPNKIGADSFFGKYEGTGASTANEIKKIGFKIWVTDENTNDIETTKSIEVDF